MVYCCKRRKKKKGKGNGERTNTGLQRVENPFRGGTAKTVFSIYRRLYKDTPEREEEFNYLVRRMKSFNNHVLKGEDMPDKQRLWVFRKTRALGNYPYYRPSELFLTPVRYISNPPADAKSVDKNDAPPKTPYLVLPDLCSSAAEHAKVRTREVLATEKEINQANLAKLMVVPPIYTVDSNYGSESEDSDSDETRVTVS
ncbi:hypothetical protein AGDE_16782 [Angomonas deanei]|nr:hypothetical protein AGDE_16782 [Angomonas deanei]|eukprot:EPY16216.1 hypothetical protein AGDE_16782 [Angomonas deanei]